MFSSKNTTRSGREVKSSALFDGQNFKKPLTKTNSSSSAVPHTQIPVPQLSDVQDLMAEAELHKDNPLYPLVTALTTMVSQQTTFLAALSAQLQAITDQLANKKVNNADGGDEEPLSAHEVERRRSIVIAGVKESSQVLPFDKWKEDNATVQTILATAGVECNAQIYRLGKPDKDKNRLIKAVFPASFFVGQALRGNKLIREVPELNKIYIRPSLTKEQRHAEYQLRQEVRERQANGEQVRIIKGQIVSSAAAQQGN